MGNMEDRHRETDQTRAEALRNGTMGVESRSVALNSKFFPLVRAGSKSSTVRKGERDVRAYESLILTDGSNNDITVRVTDVKIKRLDELTETEARRDGFESIQDLIEGLKEFYPNITLQDPVTIIGFKIIDAPQT